MELSKDPTAVAVDELVDLYRTRCLYFLRDDYHPMTRDERLRVLAYIERYGDLEAHRRAGQLRRWLSQISNAPSAA